MKIKTSSFAATLAVLLALCLVFMAPVGAAATEVSSFDELKNNLDVDGEIRFLDDITATEKITISKNITLDLNGKKLSLTVSDNDFAKSGTTVVLKNGTVNISSSISAGDGIIRIGERSKVAGNLTLDYIKVEASGQSSGAGLFIIYSSGKLIVSNSEVSVNNERSSSAYVFYCNDKEEGRVDISNTDIELTNVNSGFYWGSMSITDSTINMDGGDNGFNDVNLILDNTDVTICNGGGRGITLNGNGNVVIKGDSEIVISDMVEGSIMFRTNGESKSIQVSDSARLDVENIVSNNGEDIPIEDLQSSGKVSVGDGVTVSVNNQVVIAPTPSQPATPSSSSSGTPTPGAYFNYPRTTEDGGLVEFGTSKVVKSVTLPAGSSGKVNLHIDSTAYWPLSLDSEFTFDISVDNLGEGTSYISFKIAESKLTALELTAADVGVYHNVNGEWVKLVVTYTIEDGDVIYTAETDSFSPFKLVIEEGAAVQKEEVTPSEPVVDEPVIPDVPQDVPGEVLPDIPDIQDEPETPASPAPLFAVLAALGAAVVLRRK